MANLGKASQSKLIPKQNHPYKNDTKRSIDSQGRSFHTLPFRVSVSGPDFYIVSHALMNFDS